MRRSEREVCDKNEICRIIDNCKVCSVAMQDEKGIYVLPLNFNYDNQTSGLVLYFHSALEGRKIEAFKKNPMVAFEMHTAEDLIEGSKPCNYSYHYQSVVGTGKIQFVDDDKEKELALRGFMWHQAKCFCSFDREMLKTVLVFKLIVHEISAKQH